MDKAIRQAVDAAIEKMVARTPAELVAEYLECRAGMSDVQKRYGEVCKKLRDLHPEAEPERVDNFLQNSVWSEYFRRIETGGGQDLTRR
jgi:hypothetical protein